MMALSEKTALLEELRRRLEAEYQTLRAAQQATAAGATHEESKPENDKDTRALEQTYLARGQAARVVQLRADLDVFAQLRARAFTEESPLGLSALVRLEDERQIESLYLLAPAGAGELLESALGPVKVVTPGAPLGRALLGARVHDEIELLSPQGKRGYCVLDVA